jgi:hypothetical protein
MTASSPSQQRLPGAPPQLGGRFVAYATAVIFVLAVYSYPALRTRSVTKCERLPVISAPDLGLYLSLSSLEKPSTGFVLNPYYRVEVPAAGAGFLKFRLGPELFGWLTRLMSGRMWWSLFVWNLFWWALACAAAIWVFARFLPDASLELVLAGLSMLMFFNFGTTKEEIAAWLHFPALSHFGEIGLPYIRSFSPQVALPVLLVYLGLQVLALQKRNIRAWAAMVALQLFACATFPYATLMMAGTTAIAAFCHVFVWKRQSAWRAILLYAAICAILDSLFVFHGGPTFHSGLLGETPLVHFQAAVLRIQMGKLWILMGVLSTAVAFSRKLAPEVRWSLVGLGVTNMMMLLGDAFVPGPPLFLTNHASYFEHATLAILLTFTVGALASNLAGWSVKLRLAFVLATCFFWVNGIFLAESGYRRALPFNREQADLVNWLGRGEVGSDDLLITQHDTCGWVPFLTRAPVLFCRNSQAMLTPQQNRDIQRVREAWYLYFIGKDIPWVESVIADPNNVHRLETYGMYGEVSSYLGEERTRQVEYIRSQLTPLLKRIDTRDPTATRFLSQFKRIWIVQDQHAPIFIPARLDEYLDIHSEETSGDLVVVSATPK